MRAPLSWIKEYAALPAEVTGRELAEKFVGHRDLEVETVDEISITGPLLVGRVLEIEELTEFKKPIRYCQVDLGGPDHGIICGATNFAVGDLVPVALPRGGASRRFRDQRPEDLRARQRRHDLLGRELGINDEYDGILVLSEGEVGQDAGPVLGLDDAVLDIAVTPDRGYCLSIRGIAREAALAYGVDFTDPVSLVPDLPSEGAVREVDLQYGADRFTTRVLTDVDPDAPSPAYMVRRLNQCGMRPVSLAVDITNYVMLELGQPLHAFDGGHCRHPSRSVGRERRGTGDARPRGTRSRSRGCGDRR